MYFIGQSFLLVLCGIFLLRIAGRKSISQMTLAQTFIMISIGTIMVQPIVDKSITKAIIGGAIFVITVITLEYLQLKYNSIERFIIGKPKIIIEDGTLHIENLKKLRMTVDQLEMKLRNNGISRIEDIKTATIEPNGLLGYELYKELTPLTTEEFKQIMKSCGFDSLESHESNPQENLFTEIKNPQRNQHDLLK
ncbi:DUF421 domain-containing protein [Bacillus thuringiensis]|uniref:DUF421 domain-containing protein n=1 Tax=Bacillus thuringiensis TaxID=1428 RepID=UPI001C48C9C7|nr:YetF domain-containing protein [Bacillus thuringiensis]MBV6681965.1 DUF421 domain-containing protein [Bacillus thuringiensis]